MKTHFCKETPCIEQDKEIKKILDSGCEATYTDTPDTCACGLHWEHTGKHRPKDNEIGDHITEWGTIEDGVPFRVYYGKLQLWLKEEWTESFKAEKRISAN